MLDARQIDGYINGMHKRSSKKKSIDINQIAVSVVQKPIERMLIDNANPHKNPAAVALGRLGGLKGGKARAKKLSARKRIAIAKKAAKARWANRSKR